MEQKKSVSFSVWNIVLYLTSPDSRRKTLPGHSAQLLFSVQQEVLKIQPSKMEDGKAGILCFSLLLFFSGTGIFATDIYTNVWAVKVRGSIQQAKQLALKHGFSYERHVSCFSTFASCSCKCPFEVTQFSEVYPNQSPFSSQHIVAGTRERK